VVLKCREFDCLAEFYMRKNGFIIHQCFCLMLLQFWLYLASDKHGRTAHFHILFLDRLIAQKVYTACTKTNYKIVPLTSLNKYVHYDSREMEVNISAKNSNENLF
jgi:hypothetical protein